MSELNNQKKAAVEIVAHRGGVGPCDENTIYAFMHAKETGIDFVEMDIRLDHIKKRFYLEHDLLHHPKKRQNTLESVITNLPKGTRIMVELKSFAWIRPAFAKRFIEDYDNFFEPENTLIISFNPFVLWHLRLLKPGIQLGFLCDNLFSQIFFRSFFWKILRPDYFMLHRRMLHIGNVRFGRNHGMKIWTFVLNKRQDWHRAVTLKVDGITTDFPQALREFIKRY